MSESDWISHPVGFHRMSSILRYGVLIGVVMGLSGPHLAAGFFGRTPSSASGIATGRTCPVPNEISLRPAANGPLVWVLDGAGDLRGCSTAMSQANTLVGNLVELVPFPWSHGYRRLLLDQTDLPHARTQGARLAAVIRERKALEPGRRVVIVAHSAGCAVALAAGETLPPGSIDRMILLAPSVSTGYDIRPAMEAAREGLDVFCSKKDWVALGLVTRVVGTTDRHWTRAAGRHGFVVRDPVAAAEAEAGRLRQHFWSAELAWTGNSGGHHGMLTPAFLRTYLFPLVEPGSAF